MASDNPHPLRYAMIIQWSEQDGVYVVSLPEWGPGCKTHGATYEEAARNGQQVLETLLDSADDPFPRPAPEPKVFQYPGADLVVRSDAAPVRSAKRTA